MKIFNPHKQFEDERGLFLGIVNTGLWAEINYIETKAGKVRGGHYHKSTQELFFILDGEIEVTIQNIDQSNSEKIIASKGWIFLIEPFEIHTFASLTDSKWINMLSQAIDEQNHDFYTV